MLRIWLAQWRQPRYMLAGVLHIVVFFGFLILAARSSQMVVLGFVDGFVFPGFGGAFGVFYNVAKDVASTAGLPGRRRPRRAPRRLQAGPIRRPREARQGSHPGSPARPRADRHSRGLRKRVRGSPPRRAGGRGGSAVAAHADVGVRAPAVGPAGLEPVPHQSGSLSRSRSDVLLLPLPAPARQALPRHHVALQRLLHARADRQREAGGPRHFRCPAG